MKHKSLILIKNLIKTKASERNKSLVPGRLIMFQYNPKDRAKAYDKVPLCLILRSSRSYTLGINFHWCPIPMRKILWSLILKLNKRNVKDNKPLNIQWHQIKSFLLKTGYAPIIRLYINKRISSKVLQIPYHNVRQVIETKSADIIGYDENQLYKHAIKSLKGKKNK